VEGTVIDAKIFTRKGAEKDQRSQSIEEDETQNIHKDRDDEIRIITDTVKSKIVKLLKGKVSASRLMDAKKRKFFSRKTRSSRKRSCPGSLQVLEGNLPSQGRNPGAESPDDV